jgi:hypothetical protein
MTRNALRTVGLVLAAVATIAALSGCDAHVTPAQIRSATRAQANLTTGPSSAAAGTPVAARSQTSRR